MNEFAIKNVDGKFVVTRNNVPIDSGESNKVTEFTRIEDAQKYLGILQLLAKKRNTTQKLQSRK